MKCSCGHDVPEDEVCVVSNKDTVTLCMGCAKQIAIQWQFKNYLSLTKIQ